MKRSDFGSLRTVGGEDLLLRELKRRCAKLQAAFVATDDGWLIAQYGKSDIAAEHLAATAAVSLAQTRRSCRALSADDPDVVAMMTEFGYLTILRLGEGLLLGALNDTPDGDVVSILSTLDVSPLQT